MSHQDIEILLERYWAGDTTLDEERQLKAWFAQHTPDDAHQDAALLFQAIQREKKVETKAVAPLHVTYATPVRRYLIAAALTGIIAAGWWFARPTSPDATATAAAIPTATIPPATPESTLTTAWTDVKKDKPQRLADKARKIFKKRLHKPSEQQDEALYTEAEALQAAQEIKAALALVSRKMHRAQDASKGLKKVELVDQFIKTPS